MTDFLHSQHNVYNDTQVHSMFVLTRRRVRQGRWTKDRFGLLSECWLKCHQQGGAVWSMGILLKALMSSRSRSHFFVCFISY